MRLLYVSAPRSDFLQDVVYHGLVGVLGADAIVDFPSNPRYHGERPAEPAPWDFEPLMFDYPRHEELALEDALAAVDAVVIASLDDSVEPVVRRVLELRARPVVFLDGLDDQYVRGISRYVDAYVKREVLLGGRMVRWQAPARRLYHRLRGRSEWSHPLRRQLRPATSATRGVTALPLGVVDYGLRPEPEKTLDIVFLVGATHAVRKRVSKEVRALEDRGYRVATGVPSPMTRPPFDEYVHAMTRARVGISVRGRGFDTYRYWETPYTGAVLVAETPQIVLPDNFVDGEEAFFAPVERLVETAVAVLERDDLEEVAARGRAKVLGSHTSVQRAERLLALVERLPGRRRSS